MLVAVAQRPARCNTSPSRPLQQVCKHLQREHFARSGRVAMMLLCSSDCSASCERFNLARHATVQGDRLSFACHASAKIQAHQGPESSPD